MKPSIPKGTRDFSPETMLKRNYIFSTIKRVFEKYGFMPLETPTMENLSVLTGKYGDEGDQLIFKILNSGDFFTNVSETEVSKGSKALLPLISEKGLRYDLTVPFARYVVMNRNDITLPFKRYQMQPVWRADRPQRGRYREFYQCDADVVGTDALLCEAEIVLMIEDVLTSLGIGQFSIKINNRKVLSGIAEAIGSAGKEASLCVAIDKLDKIGWEKVREELISVGFLDDNIDRLKSFAELPDGNAAKLQFLENFLTGSATGNEGIKELKEVISLLHAFGRGETHLSVDPMLARGLSYYTGSIFEVKALGVNMGSISGGGRYDNLTGVFGMEGLSGVGISFGVDRIYDVMEELGLFPSSQLSNTQVLLCTFDDATQKQLLPFLDKLRHNGIKAEMYPDAAKLKKQFQYADKKSIPYVVIVGPDEAQQGVYSMKDMASGEQTSLRPDEIVDKLIK